MKKIFSIFFVIIIVFLNIPVAHAEAFDIDAPSYILMDLKSGQILCEKSADTRMYPASTTKIMTAIVALENGKLDQLMTANEKTIDPGEGGMNIGIMAGEQLTMEDLLHGLLIKSANETANIIAENIAGSETKFVEMMNKKAAEVGATNTHFVTTNGMHDDNHYTTVKDMAKITLYAMKNADFRRIVSLTKYDMHPTNKHSKWDTLYTINKLFYYKSDYYTEVTGIKTGYTSEAGHNLVSSVKDKDGMELVAIVFGVKSIAVDSNVYSQSRKLLEYGFKNFSTQKVAEANTKIKKVNVADAKNNAALELITSDGFSSVLPNNQNDRNIEETPTFTYSALKAPVKKGTKMGFIEYKREGITLGKVDIVASSNIEKSPEAVRRDNLRAFISSLFFKRLVGAIIIIPICFIALRIILKKASKTVKYRRRTN